MNGGKASRSSSRPAACATGMLPYLSGVPIWIATVLWLDTWLPATFGHGDDTYDGFEDEQLLIGWPGPAAPCGPQRAGITRAACHRPSIPAIRHPNGRRQIRVDEVSRRLRRRINSRYHGNRR